MADAPPARDLSRLPVAELLEQLGARTSVPAGGVSAALQAAQAAALVAMVARFSVRGKDVATDELAHETAVRADRLRGRALALAADDVAAFEEVRAAWSLPKGPERDERVRDAVAAAAVPPAQVVSVVRELVPLAERLRPVVHRSVLADLAAAMDAAGAAATTSRRNVETNVGGDRDHALLGQVADVDDLLRRAIDITDPAR